MVKEYKMVYQTYTRHQKTTLAETLINEWQKQNPPGRFLDRDEMTGLWYCIPIKAARKKVSQLLREGAPKIRTQLKTESTKRNSSSNMQGGNPAYSFHRKEWPSQPTYYQAPVRQLPTGRSLDLVNIVTPPVAQKPGTISGQVPDEIMPQFPSPVHTDEFNDFLDTYANENSPPPQNQSNAIYQKPGNLCSVQPKPSAPRPESTMANSQGASSPESVLDFDLDNILKTPSWEEQDTFDTTSGFGLEIFSGTHPSFDKRNLHLPKPQVLQYSKSNETISGSNSNAATSAYRQTSLGMMQHPSPKGVTSHDIWEPISLSSLGAATCSPDHSSFLRESYGSIDELDTSTIDILNELDQELEKGFVFGEYVGGTWQASPRL